MSFDFFNTSHLAFGLKLTQAFAQLDRMFASSEEKISLLDRYKEMFDIYQSRNYPVPIPTEEGSPCRTNELFDVFNDQPVLLGHTMYYGGDNNKFVVNVFMYDRNTNIATVGSGETTLREGYAFIQKASSNSSSAREIQFVTKESEGKGTKLFKFRIDSSNNTNISEMYDGYKIQKGDESIFSNISKGEDVSLPYTAQDYECLCVVGTFLLDVYLNDTQIAHGRGNLCRRHQIIYLKPGDKVSASEYAYAFKVNYIK